MKYLFMAGMVLLANVATAQQPLPYREIPQPPASYSAGAVAARMIDGLGFRFYWATEGLRPADLSYRPNAAARTSLQTVEHIFSMSFIIFNATQKRVNTAEDGKPRSFEEMRRVTLENLQAASATLSKSTNTEMQEYPALFSNGADTLIRPFWLLINGPIADCIWHVGQVVSFRRSSGNPFSDKVDVFSGTIRKE